MVCAKPRWCDTLKSDGCVLSPAFNGVTRQSLMGLIKLIRHKNCLCYAYGLSVCVTKNYTRPIRSSTIAILLILNTCKMYTMMSSWYDITEVVIPSPLDFGIHTGNIPSDFGADHQPLAWPSDYGLTIRLWGDNRTWSLTCINVNLWLFHVLVNWFSLHGCFGVFLVR